ncbi:hypothetical protein [Alteromonas lipolytica]|uniref:Uncharacterized protein n=1 Tax=Alteromonas lipolytica TaxID=1856405 RepID=A0A1E8FCX1_9ALTE|nr:hypothetical protein [Alteromonas lipolytica]OFI33438.1 hypothetical protein BFC17_04045 [Alteromonas lipolytica]GGF59694.1 hypothetical protein GCM10011338_09910 [Alteromonas lipolytica]
MNWLRLLVVMVAMVGCPAVSTVLHNDNAAKVHAVDLQDSIVDLSAGDSSVLSDDIDDDVDSYLPATVTILNIEFYHGVFSYHSRAVSSTYGYRNIRAPPSVS